MWRKGTSTFSLSLQTPPPAMGSSELINRRHEIESHPESDIEYSPKPSKSFIAVSKPLSYLLREERLLFVLVGMAITTVFFLLIPSSTQDLAKGLGTTPTVHPRLNQVQRNREAVFGGGTFVGKVPLGLKRKPMRIVVTGGAGFVGSHLVDRLMARGDSVIVVDNFFTGRKENLMHHFGNPNFELIRHDVVEPILLEVDQIYHLACPASPVHYKFNPVKTIKTNVVGTLNMLGLAKRVGARFLLTSTSEVYGDPLQHPQVETYWGNVNPIGIHKSQSYKR